ncbi:DUF2795 domain-containing protein [Sphaerisporangium perillae]|uniref:DUF2795 domain-containing protein n=1 Tax=Sphaerisporangium perillae TaxID=2935860 RepID=UPI002010B5D0|nr:DUF2795 domain-containing protein [Sphaerisporangium perillae]
MVQADFIHVRKFLSGVDYPATKEQLVQHAKKKGADEQTRGPSSASPTRSTRAPTASARS